MAGPTAAQAALDRALAQRCPIMYSVHHTGTVFLLEALQWHSGIRALAEMGELAASGRTPGADEVVHLHLTGRQADSRGPLDIPWRDLQRVARHGRVVAPLRDPMLALISRERRLPGADHRFIVDGFLALLELEPSAWLPVDLGAAWPADDRRASLATLLAQLQLPHEGFINRIAREWHPLNAWADGADLVRLYSIGDLETLRGRFALNYDYLVKHKDALRPFLEGHGYEDLKWWT